MGLELDVVVVVAPEDVARHVLDVPVLVVLEVVAAECMARRNVLHVLEALVVVVLVVVTAEGMGRHVLDVLRVLVTGRVEMAGPAPNSNASLHRDALGRKVAEQTLVTERSDHIVLKRLATRRSRTALRPPRYVRGRVGRKTSTSFPCPLGDSKICN